MNHEGYEIGHYAAEHREGVLGALASLLGEDLAKNDAYFGWKYEDNPHASERLGIVALHQDQVVGFRGYASSLWRAPGADTVRILVPGDTCVDPDHRRKGLSVAMGRLARRDYSDRYPVLLNLSCTRASLPGYLRLGFAPITEKVYLSSYRISGLARFLWNAKAELPLSALELPAGKDGSVIPSDTPRPAEMAAIVSLQQGDDGRLRLDQGEDWFRWRYREPAGRFRFYYLERDGDTRAYLALAVSPNNKRAYVMDYAGKCDANIIQLLEQLVSRRDFDVISIFRHSVDESIRGALRSCGFQPGGIMGALERRMRGNMPLLVRPFVDAPGEDDWLVQGRDMRDSANWAIRGICSDST